MSTFDLQGRVALVTGGFSGLGRHFATVLAAHGARVAVIWPAHRFLFGVGPSVWTITSTTLRQSVAPGAMLGRVSSVFLTVNAGAWPIGAALG